MSEAIELEAHDLAALLCSRVCHDVINPVGAIINGLEVLDDDADEETRTFAFDLIRKSATQASAKLQFARIAFGAAGSAGAEIDLGDAEKVARGLMELEKPQLAWEAPRALMPKNQVKLLLNLLLLATAAIPRGGAIKVEVAIAGDGPTFRLDSTGPSARIPPAFEQLVPGEIAGLAIDAHMIQPYYAGLLARLANMTVGAGLEGETVTILARPASAAAA
ncbi:MAG: histidine phosphotransferase ChpT [Bauldia sp.]